MYLIVCEVWKVGYRLRQRFDFNTRFMFIKKNKKYLHCHLFG